MNTSKCCKKCKGYWILDVYYPFCNNKSCPCHSPVSEVDNHIERANKLVKKLEGIVSEQKANCCYKNEDCPICPKINQQKEKYIPGDLRQVNKEVSFDSTPQKEIKFIKFCEKCGVGIENERQGEIHNELRHSTPQTDTDWEKELLRKYYLFGTT